MRVLTVFFLIFVGLISAHSQDDNIEDLLNPKPKGPELPTIDNIVQASGDNIDLILIKQLKENQERKHKPLILCLVSRSGLNNLDFSRELVKLA